MEFIRLCPKCGSDKIGMSKNAGKAAWGALSGFFCQDCSFEGEFFPEVKLDEVKDFQKKIM